MRRMWYEEDEKKETDNDEPKEEEAPTEDSDESAQASKLAVTLVFRIPSWLPHLCAPHRSTDEPEIPALP